MKQLGLFWIPAIMVASIGTSPAHSNETYNGYGNGYVSCAWGGSIIIEDYVVVESRYCRGHAEIPIGVTRISDYAFTGNGLQSVSIPSTVESIGTSAFAVNSITSVIFPEGVQTIGNGAFDRNMLTSLLIPDSVTEIEDRAFSSNQIASVKIGSGLTRLSTQLFYGNKLESVNIPNNVTSIGEEAFGYNNLRFATIGTGVSNIGTKAFMGNSFESMRFLGNAPSADPGDVFILNNEFGGGLSRMRIDVAEGSLGWGSSFSGVTVRKLKKAIASVKPSIAGKALIAKKGTNKLTAKKGTWSGVPTPSISYQWFACTSAVKSSTQTTPKTCKAISKANKTTLSVGKSLKGKYLSVRVIGKGSGTSETIWFSKSSQKVK